MVPFESLSAVSCSSSIVTMAVSVAVCDKFSVKEWCDLKTGLGFVQRHSKWIAYEFLFAFHSNYGPVLYNCEIKQVNNNNNNNNNGFV